MILRCDANFLCGSNTKYDAGEEFATRVDDAYTRSAMGIRVPAAVGDFLILRAVRESGGFCIAVDDDAIDAGRSFRMQMRAHCIVDFKNHWKLRWHDD